MKTVENHQEAPGCCSGFASKSGGGFFGSRPAPHFFTAAPIQAKLSIGEPGDRYEQEADRVADAVVRQSEAQPPAIQTMCASCAAHARDEDGHERQPVPQPPAIQLKAESKRPVPASSFESRLAESRGGGQPMPAGLRHQMEASLGTGLDQVQLHTGAAAVQMNQELGARAFTHKQDIYFGQGQYQPESREGKRLLAHELTHTLQQGRGGQLIQADFAIEPTTPARHAPTLSAARMQAELAFNRARHTDAAEIGMMRDVLGLDPAIQLIDEDFVNALLSFQAQYGLEMDGRLGRGTADLLAREIIAEADYLGPGNFPGLQQAFAVQAAIQTLITANNRTYNDYRDAIRNGTMLQQHVALRNQQLLRDLQGQLSWNNWARCIELLGRQAPTAAEMLRNATVRATLTAAWTASNAAITRWNTPGAGPLAAACNPVPGAPAPAAHEEGGWIYMNLITGDLSTRRAAAGAQAAIQLNTGAPTVADSVMVGTFHTHPNVGNCWGAVTPSNADTNNANARGIPNLIRGAFPALANIASISTGPNRRAHLAGNRLAPGAAGGLAPQPDVLGREQYE